MVLERANEIVTDYATDRLKNSVRRAEKEMKHKGCGCLRCARSAVNEVNDWIDWVGRGEVSQEYADSIKYRIEFGGRHKWKIIQGKE